MPTKDPEKKKIHDARYRAKHAEKLRANAKAKHAERMANDPEYVAKQKEKAKRALEAFKLRMATDPEYAKRERARARGKYDPEKAKAYYEANKEKLRAQANAWHAKNPEYAKEYYKQNKERLNQITKDWMKANPERLKATRKEYAEKNREKINQQALESLKRRYAQDPDKIRAQRKANKQKQFEKDPAAYVAKRNELLRRCSKRKVDEVRDNYIAHLLGKSTGVKLKAEDIPKELIEAKRLHVLIQREVRNEKCK
jgi:hypothetical protein